LERAGLDHQVSLVVITDSDLGEGVEEEVLEAAGHEVRRGAGRTAADVVDAAAGAEALIVQWAPITAEILAELPSLRFVSRLGIGVDMVDLDAATAHGVAVANTPEYCIDEVVAHTLAFVLAATRGIVQHDRALRAGGWAPIATYPGAARPSQRTVAVVGLGRIGARVATQLAALGFRVLGVDPFADAPDGAEPARLDDALATADIVTLHLPLTAATRHLLDGAAFARMRPGAALVNTCRGGLVDEAALLAALADGRLAGAYLDVFESEPLPATSPLRTADRVVLSAHAAWYSPAALAELPRSAAAQVVDFLAGRTVPSIVNPAYVTKAPDLEEGTWTTN
jgi:D-3-phosphoglycerate dehydrogenase / 2-oxoglutarate reductase